MEYELEERPRQMGEDWNDEWPIAWLRPPLSPMLPARGLRAQDCALLIPEQEPIS